MTNGFYGPRSRANAKRLVEAAKALNIPTRVVKTTVGGYTAPQEVLDLALGIQGIEPDVEYPPLDEPDREEVEGLPEPLDKPRGNYGRDQWAHYATWLGLTVTDEMTRNDIRDLVNEKE